MDEFDTGDVPKRERAWIDRLFGVALWGGIVVTVVWSGAVVTAVWFVVSELAS